MKKLFLLASLTATSLVFTACSGNSSNETAETSVSVSQNDPLTPLKELIAEVEANGDEYTQAQWEDINKLYQITLTEIPPQKLNIEKVTELQKLSIQYLHLMKEKRYHR